MPFTCAFDAGFDSGFEICPTDEAQPDPRTLRGVPSAIPRIRKRPDVTDISGVGYVGVIGAGGLTGEASIAGYLPQAVDLSGELVRETFRYLVEAISVGAESLLSAEYALNATMAVVFAGYGLVARESHASGRAAVTTNAYASLAVDQMAQGRASIPVGGEGAVIAEENEESLILAAGAMIARLLTD